MQWTCCAYNSTGATGRVCGRADILFTKLNIKNLYLVYLLTSYD